MRIRTLVTALLVAVPLAASQSPSAERGSIWQFARR